MAMRHSEISGTDALKTASLLVSVRDRAFFLPLIRLAFDFLAVVERFAATKDNPELFFRIVFFDLGGGISLYSIFLYSCSLVILWLCWKMTAPLFFRKGRLMPDGIMIRDGFWRRKYIFIRYNNITTISTDRGWWQRIVGTGDLHISAGGWTDIVFEGVSDPECVLKAILEQKHRSEERQSGVGETKTAPVVGIPIST